MIGLPIANCRLPIEDQRMSKSAIGNRKAEMKKPRAKQRGTSKWFEVFRVSLSGCPSCLAGYFPWPQVALTHHAFHRCLYAWRARTVKFEERCCVVSTRCVRESS